MILDDQVRSDNSDPYGYGFIKVILESDDDLYNIQKLLLASDHCGIGTNYKKMGKKDGEKTDFEVAIKSVEFDGASILCVVGMTVASNCNSVRVGSFQKMNFEKGKILTLRKTRWDPLDRALLERAKYTGVSPIGILLLHQGVGEIFLISESYTAPLWRSHREEDEIKHFDEVMEELLSNIHFNSIDHMIVASEGSIQKKFHGYLFKELSMHNDKMKAVLSRKPNFHMVEISAANNREALKNALLHASVKKRINTENRRPFLEVATWRNFQDQVIKRPGFISTNQGTIMQFLESATELLISETLLRELPARAQYALIVSSLLGRRKKVTFFSPFHVWHEDLMQVGGIAVIFDVLVQDIMDGPNED